MNTKDSIEEMSDQGAEELFQELQSIWEEQDRRIDEILAKHNGSPHRINYRHRTSHRHREMIEYMFLFVFNVSVGISALLLLLPDSYILIRVAGIVFGSTNFLLAIKSLVKYVDICRHSPVRVDFEVMKRYARRNAEDVVFVSPRQIAAVGLMAMTMLTAVSCAPIGDGHNMTGFDPKARVKAITDTATILSQIESQKA